ncbi:hypothetical protein Z947_1755 [Sulfitobacter geojensis]|nr:hypothetical protein Z947_1755 [Sulfitobacter geojensis]
MSHCQQKATFVITLEKRVITKLRKLRGWQGNTCPLWPKRAPVLK